ILVAAQGFSDLDAELIEQLTDELNVAAVAPLSDAQDSLVSVTAKANFRALGKRFGKTVQVVAVKIASANAAESKTSLQTSGHCLLALDGEQVAISPDEVVITETPRHGWAVATESGATVALDLEITAALRRAGIARDAVRQIQEARKTGGLDIADRIVL